MSRIYKSQVGRLCVAIDDKVKAFLARPIEGDWPYLYSQQHCARSSTGLALGSLLARHRCRELAGCRLDRREASLVVATIAPSVSCRISEAYPARWLPGAELVDSIAILRNACGPVAREVDDLSPTRGTNSTRELAEPVHVSCEAEQNA